MGLKPRWPLVQPALKRTRFDHDVCDDRVPSRARVCEGDPPQRRPLARVPPVRHGNDHHQDREVSITVLSPAVLRTIFCNLHSNRSLNKGLVTMVTIFLQGSGNDGSDIPTRGCSISLNL
ncbi:hypothetical protein J6590_067936 [Homalodisca vitripennis]|nr:hypothetical protein J6590_067936 [Homalodisca vitripennis]